MLITRVLMGSALFLACIPGPAQRPLAIGVMPLPYQMGLSFLPDQEQNYRTMTEGSFITMRALFRQVVGHHNDLRLDPRNIEWSDGRHRVMLHPHERNLIAIQDFHDRFQRQGTRFLNKVARDNDGAFLLFIGLPSQYLFKRFFEKDDRLLRIPIYAYDSFDNRLSVSFFVLDHHMLRDQIAMQQMMQATFLKVLVQVLAGRGGGR